jgi:hypothetical protein
MILSQGLDVEHVETAGADLARAQRLHQGGLVDDAAARTVDEHDTVLHPGEFIGADQGGRRSWGR